VEALAVFEMTQRGFTELLSTVRSDQDHARQSQAELEQRKVIERATGVLMERHGLSADTAAERIRQTAAHQGRASPSGRRPPISYAGRPQRADADPDDSAHRAVPVDVMPGWPRRQSR
jgi:hypothetical protein